MIKIKSFFVRTTTSRWFGLGIAALLVASAGATAQPRYPGRPGPRPRPRPPQQAVPIAPFECGPGFFTYAVHERGTEHLQPSGVRCVKFTQKEGRLDQNFEARPTMFWYGEGYFRNDPQGRYRHMGFGEIYKTHRLDGPYGALQEHYYVGAADDLFEHQGSFYRYANSSARNLQIRVMDTPPGSAQPNRIEVSGAWNETWTANPFVQMPTDDRTFSNCGAHFDTFRAMSTDAYGRSIDTGIRCVHRYTTQRLGGLFWYGNQQNQQRTWMGVGAPNEVYYFVPQYGRPRLAVEGQWQRVPPARPVPVPPARPVPVPPAYPVPPARPVPVPPAYPVPPPAYPVPPPAYPAPVPPAYPVPPVPPAYPVPPPAYPVPPPAYPVPPAQGQYVWPTPSVIPAGFPLPNIGDNGCGQHFGWNRIAATTVVATQHLLRHCAQGGQWCNNVTMPEPYAHTQCFNTHDIRINTQDGRVMETWIRLN